ncbi:MAG: cell division protein FtsZ, partial [Thermoactinospora sp.]|nr:cell division protein FtsZ [Thermoactinospora sp.]
SRADYQGPRTEPAPARQDYQAPRPEPVRSEPVRPVESVTPAPAPQPAPQSAPQASAPAAEPAAETPAAPVSIPKPAPEPANAPTPITSRLNEPGKRRPVVFEEQEEELDVPDFLK